MALQWMDGFDHYGPGPSVANMLLGAWADSVGAGVDLAVPAAGARTGEMCLRVQSGSNDNYMRRVLPTATDNLIVGMGVYMDSLPVGSADFYLGGFLSGGNALMATVSVGTTGTIELRIGTGPNSAVVGVTTGPVLVAGSWQHVEFQIFRDAGAAGTFVCNVDGVEVLNLNTLTFGANTIAQIRSAGVYFGSGSGNLYQDDLIIKDTSGTANNAIQGDLRVATLNPIANGVNQGWATGAIQHIGTGVMDFIDDTTDKAITYADDAEFEFGAGDFTIECAVRFNETVPDDDTWGILSKWLALGDQRSWRLGINGASVGGDLFFETCEDGTDGDVVKVHSYAFVPIVNRWYYIAVSRDGTDSRMFLSEPTLGQVEQVGITQTDSRTYFAGTALMLINGSEETGSTPIIDGSAVTGWFDAVRLTKGAALYTANFATPTAALTSDANTSLLLNFDSSSNPDESTNAFVGTLRNSAAVIFPADSEAYQTIQSLDPDDDDFVEAELVAATGTLTLTDQPLDTETVTLGSFTYTFQTALVDAAYNVLIGADAEESLDNLLAAVNLEAGAGTTYGTATALNTDAFLTDLTGLQVFATARAAGAAGNSLASTETLTNGAWSAATLLGGLDIPTNSEFTVSALPPEVTGVRGVSVVSRSFKTDNGASSLQMSFVTDGGVSDQGADRPMGLSPVYYEDTFDLNPAAGSWTPTDIVGSRIRLDRTL